MEEILIAPCGINCRVCGMYQKRSHPCLGCRLRTTKKSHLCVIKNCREERWSSPSLCLGCAKFPCPRLRALDQRYREKTAEVLSVVENLLAIQEKGMEAFLHEETEKWTCPHCGEVLRAGSSFCPACGQACFPQKRV